MNITDIILVMKTVRELDLNQGLIMSHAEESIAIVKREDTKGIYYSINHRIDGKTQKPYNDDDIMMLLLVNKERFTHKSYTTKIVNFK